MNSGRIGDIATIIDYRGRTPPKSPNGIKLLTAKVIKDGRIDESRLEYISEETYAWWMRRGFPQQGDILLTTEAPLGEATVLRTREPIALAQRVILLRGNPSIVDQQYFFAALRSPLMQDRLRQRATGTTVLGIKQRELRQVQVPLPPLTTQHKIGAILSAYDDLIENNNRRVKLLEELAQRIYLEWFVDFRFPGHENVQLVDSDLGPVPEGWDVVPVGEITPILGGGTPSKTVAEYWEGGTVTWFTPTDLTSADAMFVFTSRMKITEQGLAHSSAKMFPAGSVMLTSRATIGVVAIATVPAATNQGFITCPSTPKVGTFHLYFWLSQQRELIISLASGATFKEINKTTFRQIPFLRADARIAKEFEGLVEPIAQEIQNLLQAQRNLRATARPILPRLISGEIDVTDLDISVPEAAA